MIDHLGEVARKNVVQIWRSRAWSASKSTKSSPAICVAVVGLEPIEIGDTVADADDAPRPAPLARSTSRRST